MTPTFHDIQQDILRMDPSLDTTDTIFKVAAILLSSLVVGPNARKIARYTAFPYRFVMRVSRRLRTSRVWIGTKVAGAGWADPELGGTAFWLDVCVGLGWLKRSTP